MSTRVTIVGCGQVGASIASFLLKKQNEYSLRLIESSCRQRYRQHPWGWMRRITLQQKIRQPKQVDNLEIPFAKHGPMLLTTDVESTKHVWTQWIESMKGNTTARILERQEAHRLFHLDTTYALLCDDRDHLVDFDAYRSFLVEHLQHHPRVQWMEGPPVSRYHVIDGCLRSLEFENGEILPISRHEIVLFAIGNQTTRLFSYPMVGIRLCYQEIPHIADFPYIALWNRHSSFQCFDTFTKVGCGYQGKIEAFPSWRHVHLFVQVLSKYHYVMNTGTSKRQFLEKAYEELSQVTQRQEIIPDSIAKAESIQSCMVDVTPTFRPIVDHPFDNTFVICGMSGSGFTAHEPWFLEKIEASLQSRIHHLPQFSPALFSRRCRNPDERSYLY